MRFRPAPALVLWPTLLALLGSLTFLGPARPAWAELPRSVQDAAVESIVELHGQEHEMKARVGVEQVAARWRPEDGDEPVFLDFIREQYLADPVAREHSFERLSAATEAIQGHYSAMGSRLRWALDVADGPIEPVDRLLAAWSPSAHLAEDLFASKVAFAVLLNWRIRGLAERMEQGPRFTRRDWAEARLVEPFISRVSAEAFQGFTAATADADAYVSEYNLWIYHLLAEDGRRLWDDPQQRLISHWNLRDELKANYSEESGLEKQRMIQAAMEHIVRQTIPAIVIDNPDYDWMPISNRVFQVESGKEMRLGREADTRYAVLLAIFHAAQAIDAERPDNPSYFHRSFEEERELSANDVRRLLLSLFDAPQAARVAGLIQQRLGRPLEPFDIWYAGFKPRAAFAESELDALTRERYPDAAAFQADLPRILGELGFDEGQVALLIDHIEVDPSRGAGHAQGAALRGDKARLRTRVGDDGMDYKGYNIAVHELGHNVEQVFSLENIDEYLLNGVPMNAFTEALAFVFQERDLELLGLSTGDVEARHHLAALESYWGSCEIAGAALVDMAVWEWLYANPQADAAQFREAAVRISEEIWNQTFGKLMGVESSALLGIYSHMLAYPLYLANYPIGHVIAYQLEEYFRGRDLGEEFERVSRIGRLSPQIWMREAVGQRLSTQSMLDGVEAALDAME